MAKFEIAPQFDGTISPESGYLLAIKNSLLDTHSLELASIRVGGVPAHELGGFIVGALSSATHDLFIHEVEGDKGGYQFLLLAVMRTALEQSGTLVSIGTTESYMQGDAEDPFLPIYAELARDVA